LLDPLRDAEMIWENICLARKLLRGILKSVAVQKELERTAGMADSDTL